MNVQLSKWDVVKISAASFLLFIAISVTVGPRLVSAQANVDAVANAMCNPFDPQCPVCGMKYGCQGQQCGCIIPGNKNTCPCQGPHTSGICDAPNHCKATAYNEQAGQKGGAPGMDQLMQALKGIMDALKGGGGGGGGGGSPSQTPTSQGCTSYHQTSNQQDIATDPCAYYVPPVSGSIDTSIGSSTGSDLLNSLNGSTNVSDQLTGALNSTSTGTDSTAPANVFQLNQVVNLQGGIRGNIEVTSGGATVYAGSRDTQANVEVAGFYGSDATFGGQGQGIVARMCVSRPWSTNFLSSIIPPTFFDNLCTWRGYQVGVPPPPTAPVVQRIVKPVVQSTTQPTTTPVYTGAGPVAEIWAVPTSVPLGSRTSVFWNTKNVSSCKVTSPDGSFNESSLSGGASTVPITTSTTFTISCIGLDGTHATNFVTVNIKI